MRRPTSALSSALWAASFRESPSQGSTTNSVQRSGSRFRSASASPRFARVEPKSESARRRRPTVARRTRTSEISRRARSRPRTSHRPHRLTESRTRQRPPLDPTRKVAETACVGRGRRRDRQTRALDAIATSGAMRDHIHHRAVARRQRQIVVGRRRRVAAPTRLASRLTRLRRRRRQTSRRLNPETGGVGGDVAEEGGVVARRARVVRPND